jgi:hypothetical protein
VQAAIERASTEQFTIVPSCPFPRTSLTEHPDAVGGIDTPRTCGCACTVATSAAATALPTGTPPSTGTTTPTTLSSAPTNAARTGGVATLLALAMAARRAGAAAVASVTTTE